DPGDQANNTGDSVSLQLQASDSVSGSLTYSASALPTGLSLNASTGLISGTISAATNSTFATSLSVTDGTNTVVDALTWSIGPILLSDPGSQTSHAGDAVSLQIQAYDLNNAAILYSAVGLPAGLHMNPYTGEITGAIASSAAS